MKLITLNILGGRIFDPFIEFIKANKNHADFFCFQEVYKSDRSVITPGKFHSNILGELANELSDWDYLFSPTYHGRDFFAEVDYPLSQGSAVFWRKNLDPKKKGEIFVYKKENETGMFEKANKLDPPKNFQYLIFDNFLLINLHGFWEPAPKLDTPERFKQTEIILEFVKKYNIPKIIAGDFNLGIDTKALLMFEEAGFRNLVKESKIETTRSSLYDIKWRKIDKFADYIFVSKDVKVNDFKVMEDEVSDHLPLYLEFEV